MSDCPSKRGNSNAHENHHPAFALGPGADSNHRSGPRTSPFKVIQDIVNNRILIKPRDTFMFSEVFERFIQNRPVALMVRVLLESFLNANKLDRWFDTVRHVQYTRNLVFIDCRPDAPRGVQHPAERSFRLSSFRHSGLGRRPVWQVATSRTDDLTRFSSVYCRRSGSRDLHHGRG